MARQPKSDEETTDERTRALKERIYATFTGLAILAAASVEGHATAPHVLAALVVGVLGISIAGFLAEVVAHQVSHRSLPEPRELRVMARIAAGAFTSVIVPAIVLALSWIGLLTAEHAIWLGMILYGFTLVVIILLASARSGLKPLQRVVSSAMLVGLALVVVVVLTLAH